MKVTPGNTLDCFNMFQPCEAWRITEGTKRFLYNLLRCGNTFLDILKKATDDVPWNWSGQETKTVFKHDANKLNFIETEELSPSAFTLENMDGGEWFVPGTTLGGLSVTDPFWKQVKAW